MRPFYEDPCFTFRFAHDRIIPRFHLEDIQAGRRVGVHRHSEPGVDHGDELVRFFPTAPVGSGMMRTAG
jgi:hypothetical protein